MHSFKEVSTLFTAHIDAHDIFPKIPENLYEPCRYLLKAGGKRVRPALCLMANELFGDIKQDAYHVAMAVELFHNFTLIHDDIMDQSPLRRGMPTVHVKFGTTAAILSGDVMNIFAFRCLDSVSATHLPAVLQLFNQTAIAVCEGQQWDMDFEQKEEVGMKDYLNMIELKTAVLLACSLQSGALLGGAGSQDQQHLYEFGRCLGLAFQLQDDYLDTFGDEAVIGKTPGGDIRANKKTALFIKCREQLNQEQLSQFNDLLKEEGDHKVAAVKTWYQQQGVDQYCSELISQYSLKSFDHLDKVSVAEDKKQALKDLAIYLLHRNH